MKLNPSYRRIFTISLPIMIGSAAQNVIALTDSIFLYHVSEADFAAIGFVGVYYLIVAAIGFGFSRGGQIIVARRVGEGDPAAAGVSYYAMLVLELILALILFLLVRLGSEMVFSIVVDSPSILTKSLLYLDYRAWGIFPAFAGVAIVAFYTGIARTRFIMIDTVILIVVNVLLNYSLIYGKFGLPEMGIAGAGLASTLAEVVALVAFLLYMFFDRKLRRYLMLRLPPVDLSIVLQTLKIGAPIVAQAVVGLGSWFFFFSLIENMGERALAVSNLARIVYLILSVPCWGYCVGVNTLVSNLLGQNEPKLVGPVIGKTIKLCLATTMAISLPILLLPTIFLYPFFGSEDMSLLYEAQPIFYILFILLTLFSIGGIYFNGMIGAGATWAGLKLQALCSVLYLATLYFAVNTFHVGLIYSWLVEVIYWLPLIFLVYRYMHSSKWYRVDV